MNDPTFDTYTLNTIYEGDFSHILNLSKFTKNQFPSNELPFILDIISQLGNESIECQIHSEMITQDSIFNLLKNHEKYDKIFAKDFCKEIDFTSSHFYELCEDHEEEFLNLSINTVIQIINSDKLQLKNEDQLLKFVNKLYLKDKKYSVLYDSIYFVNVSSETMKEFLSNFDNNDMNRNIWIQLSKRIEQEIVRNKNLEEEMKSIMKMIHMNSNHHLTMNLMVSSII